MSILFAGTPENAATTLRELVAAGTPISLVLTRPDTPVGRKAIITPSAVALTANELGIPCIKTTVVDDQILKQIATHQIDFAIVVAFGVFLKAPVLKALPKGWFNLHYSLLPKLRGAAPVQWAIFNGYRETGVTLFKIDEGLDTGAIVGLAPTQIQPSETAGELLARLTHLGVSVLLENLPKIDANLVVFAKQDDSQATGAPKLSRVDGRLDFSQPANQVDARARGANPEPGAWFNSSVGQVKVLGCRPVVTQVPSGELQLVDGKVLAGAAVGSVELLEVQPAGKKSMKATDWFRGLRDQEVKVTND